MKTNEAPEKIYLYPYSTDGIYEVETKPLEGTVEFIRTDTFINKAVEYILTHIPDMHILGDSCGMDECIIEDFKNYMKGE